MTPAPETERVVRCFVVLDLVGFTALNDTHGDTLAAQLAVSLAAHAKASVLPGVEVVKYLGDGVLVAAAAVGTALEFVDQILERLAADAFPLAVRVGVHEGPAVAVEGDYLGSSLNLVARLSHEARPGQVIATADVAVQASDLGLDVAHIGDRDLRHIGEPVSLYAILVPALSSSAPLDPVCHMRLTEGILAITLRWRDETIGFCSADCAERFGRDPDRFVGHVEDC